MGADGKVVQPAALTKSLEAFREPGLTSASFDEQYGGGQLPYVNHATSSRRSSYSSAAVVASAVIFVHVHELG